MWVTPPATNHLLNGMILLVYHQPDQFSRNPAFFGGGYQDCRYYERRTEKTPRSAVQLTHLDALLGRANDERKRGGCFGENTDVSKDSKVMGVPSGKWLTQLLKLAIYSEFSH